ncbi:MAG TPA: SAM hydroxide adenosyltransferase [Opitutaceae bacterium]
MHRHRFFLLVLCLFPALLPAVTVEQGEIDGAKYAIARPDRPWNGGLLLLGHGHRAETAPLVADLFPEQAAYKSMLDAGWIVASTSYRRNGIILGDAIADLDALRAYVEKKDGELKRVILEGESMGGMIATLIAERSGDDYQGVIAIGSALNLREPGGISGLSLQPRIPLLFMSNQSELEGPRQYLANLRKEDRETVPPALFRVSRDGHVNVNQRERIEAFRALNAWIDRGRDALPAAIGRGEVYDVTQVPEPGPSQVVAAPDGRGFAATITEVSAIYGNLWINAQPADFAAAGIRPGAWFQVTAGDRTFRVHYGRDFGSVERGQWVVFPNADGFFWLARNYGNAAETAGLKVGDAVAIRRYDDAGQP